MCADAQDWHWQCGPLGNFNNNVFILSWWCFWVNAWLNPWGLSFTLKPALTVIWSLCLSPGGSPNQRQRGRASVHSRSWRMQILPALIFNLTFLSLPPCLLASSPCALVQCSHWLYTASVGSLWTKQQHHITATPHMCDFEIANKRYII